MKNIVYFLAILFFANSLNGFSKTNSANVSKRGTVAATFLKVSQGARATGMGSAFTAISDDQSAMYWNVAGIARQGDFGVQFDHTKWFADLNYNYLSASANLGSYGAVGLSLTTSNYGDMKVTTVSEPNGTGEIFSASDIAVNLGWAINLTDNFSIGIAPKVVYQSIWKTSSVAAAVDLGVLYNTPFKGITLGMAITNFGQKMHLTGESTSILYDQDYETVGNNGKIPGSLNTENWDLPLCFKVGVSYVPINTEMHKLIIAVDAAHPNDNYEYLNVGCEYTLLKTIALRAGWKSLFLKDSEEGLTLGVGLKQFQISNVRLSFDYSYSDFGRFDNIQKFSMAVNL
jgi:hypothetical protein